MVIRGEIVGKKVDSLYLLKATDDPRGAKTIVRVVNGRFRHTLTADSKQAYEFIYPHELHQSSWNPITFFSEPDTLIMTLHPEDFYQDIFKGGFLTQEYYNFSDSLKHAVVPKFDKLYQKIDSLSSLNRHDSTGIEYYYQKIDSLAKVYYETENQYIATNQTPVSYYLLFERVQQADSASEFLKEQFVKHSKIYPNHPYTYVIRSLLKANDEIKIGGKYVNFKAPTLDGREFELSGLIQNKVTLLNLWASWCGPCIRKSRELVPVYNEYKLKGFNVIGVAREFQDTNQLKIALERDDFPWLNLVDLNDERNIWLKYGIPYSGGGMFLIDEHGQIIAIDPSMDEVRNILSQKL